jgi:hypothetical protein
MNQPVTLPACTTRRAEYKRSYRAFFLAAFPAFFAGFVRLLLAFTVASSGISLLAIGDPSPVHASHPGPAEKAPLLPTVMSLNAETAFAA